MDFTSPIFYIPMIFLSLVAILVAFLYKDARKYNKESIEGLPFYDEVNLSIDYIGRNTLTNGRFKYRNHIDARIKYDNDLYNSLRHAGVLYSMYMYEKFSSDDKYKEARIKSSMYFVKKYIKKNDDKFFIESNPKEEQIAVPIVKSGACGVALCALCNLYKEQKIELELLQGIGEYILTMIDNDGTVYAYYDLKNETINKTAQAVFYPGEVASGLLYLYEIDKQEKWLKTAKKVLTKLAKDKKSLELSIEFDNWSLLAIELLFKNNLVDDYEKSQLISFAEQMAISIMSDQITNKNHSYFGAFKDNIRPCSLGTIMEGLCSVYFITPNNSMKKLLVKALSIGCYFLSRVQVKTGEQAGGLPNSANWVKSGVTPNAGMIRIDNVQHVLTCWLKFQQILKITKDY